MDMNVWLAFLAAACLIAVSPGSGAVLSMSHGLAYGVRKTSATIAGLQTGLVVIMLIAGLGVGAVLVASATAFLVVKVLGAAYLMWLGWKQWRSPVAETAPSAGQAVHQALDAASAQGHGLRARYVAGLLTNLTNPKGIVFMVAVLPQFIDPQRPLALQMLVLLATMVSVDVTVMHGYAFLASRLQQWLRSARARRLQNRVFGGVLAFMGASLLLVRRVGA